MTAAFNRDRWWRTFAFTAPVDVLALLSGLLVGIALTLYYFDLEAPTRAR